MSAQATLTNKFHKTTYPSLDPTRPEHTAQGKTIVITGGGTGIGAAAAKNFAQAGASRIALLGRREGPLLSTKAAIELENPATKVFVFPTDITKKAEVDAVFEKIASQGHIDVLISNAAVIGHMGTFADTTADNFLSGITTNLTGNVNIAHAFLKHATQNATLIETNSSASHLILPAGWAAYSVAKAATARFYASLAIEHPDMSFFSVHPGVVETDMAKEAGYKPQKEGEDFIYAEAQSDVVSLISQYDDVNLSASFMVWLASGEARFLNGKFLWANWDVEELKARKEEVQNSQYLSLGLIQWPFAWSFGSERHEIESSVERDAVSVLFMDGSEIW